MKEFSVKDHEASWLPEGNWVDMFSGRIYRGGRTMVISRTVDSMAVFGKAGGILPLSRQEPGDNSVENPKNMDVYLFAGADGAYRLYEDAGDGYTYREGKCAYTEFKFTWGEKSALSVSASGDKSVLPEERSFRLCLRGVKNCKAVGENILSQNYDEETLTLFVQLKAVTPNETVQVEFEGTELADNQDFGKRVFDFLMGATLPTLMKREIYKVYKEATTREDIALTLHTLDIPDSVMNVLYELTFA